MLPSSRLRPVKRRGKRVQSHYTVPVDAAVHMCELVEISRPVLHVEGLQLHDGKITHALHFERLVCGTVTSDNVLIPKSHAPDQLTPYRVVWQLF
jgi:hypothetical protein